MLSRLINPSYSKAEPRGLGESIPGSCTSVVKGEVASHFAKEFLKHRLWNSDVLHEGRSRNLFDPLFVIQVSCMLIYQSTGW